MTAPDLERPNLGVPYARLLEIVHGGASVPPVRFQEAKAMAVRLLELRPNLVRIENAESIDRKMDHAEAAVIIAQRATIRRQDERIREMEESQAAVEVAVSAMQEFSTLMEQSFGDAVQRIIDQPDATPVQRAAAAELKAQLAKLQAATATPLSIVDPQSETGGR